MYVKNLDHGFSNIQFPIFLDDLADYTPEAKMVECSEENTDASDYVVPVNPVQTGTKSKPSFNPISTSICLKH